MHGSPKQLQGDHHQPDHDHVPEHNVVQAVEPVTP
jgi:hypothetical protein